MNIETKYDYGQEVQVKHDGEWVDAVITLIEIGDRGLQYVLKSKKSHNLYAREGEIRLKPIFTEEELEELGVSIDVHKSLCENAVRLYLAREPKAEMEVEQ